jgi:hypothetical protein
MPLSATGATEQVAATHPAADKGELIGSRFLGNPKIPAGLPPFRTMGGQPPTPMAILGQKMGKFMKQCLLDLNFGDIAKGRV